MALHFVALDFEDMACKAVGKKRKENNYISIVEREEVIPALQARRKLPLVESNKEKKKKKIREVQLLHM